MNLFLFHILLIFSLYPSDQDPDGVCVENLNVTTTYGKTIRIRTFVGGIKSIFSPPDDRKIIWKKDYRSTITSSNKYTLGTSNRSLTIESPTSNEGGTYTIELVRENSRRIEVLSTASILVIVTCKFQASYTLLYCVIK